MFKKLCEKIKAKAVAAKAAVTGVMIGAMTMPVFALTPATDIDPTAIISNIANWLLSILTYVGLVFIVWGGFQFGMAMKDEDAASKSKAILVLIAGVVMVGLKAVLTAFGVLAAS